MAASGPAVRDLRGDPDRGLRRARVAWASVIAAALWFASGALAQALRWFAELGSLPAAFLPGTMPGVVWTWPSPWGVVVSVLGALCVGLAVAAVLTLLRRRGRGLIVPWFAVIVAGAFAGAVVDIALVVAHLGEGMRVRAALTMSDPAAYAAAGAYWGLIQGWIAALPCALGARRAGRPLEGAALGRPRAARAAAAVVLALALIGGIVYGVVAVQGMRAARVANAQEAALAQGASEEDGALPDPFAEGEPVPAAGEAEGPRDPSWCSPEQTTLMRGTADAATGHRVLPIRLVNISDEPCTVEGYPDIAFGDQNGHLLEVRVEHGGSFLAEDPGPEPVVLEPGATAIASIGWDANPTAGALVAAELHAAQAAGDPRLSWTAGPDWPALDIVAGSSVAVTAWAPDRSAPLAGSAG